MPCSEDDNDDSSCCVKRETIVLDDIFDEPNALPLVGLPPVVKATRTNHRPEPPPPSSCSPEQVAQQVLEQQELLAPTEPYPLPQERAPEPGRYMYDEVGRLSVNNLAVLPPTPPPYLEELLADEASLRSYVREGRTRVRLRFTPQVFIEGTLVALYYNVVQNGTHDSFGHSLNMLVRISRGPWTATLRDAGFNRVPQHDSIVIDPFIVSGSLQHLGLGLKWEDLEQRKTWADFVSRQDRFFFEDETKDDDFQLGTRRPLKSMCDLLTWEGKWVDLNTLLPATWLKWCHGEQRPPLDACGTLLPELFFPEPVAPRDWIAPPLFPKLWQDVRSKPKMSRITTGKAAHNDIMCGWMMRSVEVVVRRVMAFRKRLIRNCDERAASIRVNAVIARFCLDHWLPLYDEHERAPPWEIFDTPVHCTTQGDMRAAKAAGETLGRPLAPRVPKRRGPSARPKALTKKIKKIKNVDEDDPPQLILVPDKENVQPNEATIVQYLLDNPLSVFDAAYAKFVPLLDKRLNSQEKN